MNIPKIYRSKIQFPRHSSSERFHCITMYIHIYNLSNSIIIQRVQISKVLILAASSRSKTKQWKRINHWNKCPQYCSYFPRKDNNSKFTWQQNFYCHQLKAIDIRLSSLLSQPELISNALSKEHNACKNNANSQQLQEAASTTKIVNLFGFRCACELLRNEVAMLLTAMQSKSCHIAVCIWLVANLKIVVRVCVIFCCFCEFVHLKWHAKNQVTTKTASKLERELGEAKWKCSRILKCEKTSEDEKSM